MNQSIRKIAVLITSHNRKAKTLCCLESLFSQNIPDKFMISVFLVDDGSTDGTKDEIKNKFPMVNVILGDGTLYWCGGMRLAWETANENDYYEFFLWLNDDVKLKSGALSTLIDAYFHIRSTTKSDSIIVGACLGFESGKLIYGGYKKPISDGLLDESSELQQCYSMNGNIVLIPRVIAVSVGNLSKNFTHAMGDIDYGIRAINHGFSIYVAPGILGLCGEPEKAIWMNPKVPFIKRWRNLHSPKGLPPKEYMILRKRMGLRFWFIVPLKLLIQVCFPKIFNDSVIYKN